jgi:hypothetical protein
LEFSYGISSQLIPGRPDRERSIIMMIMLAGWWWVIINTRFLVKYIT